MQETGKQKGFLIFRAIHKDSSDLLGFALGVFRISDMIETALGRLREQSRDIIIFDEGAPRSDRLLYYHSPSENQDSDDIENIEPIDIMQGLHHVQHLEVAGRNWLIINRASPSYIGKRRTYQPWALLFVGIIFTGLIVFFIALRQTTENTLLLKNRELERLNKEIQLQQAQLIQSEKMSSIGQRAGNTRRNPRQNI